MTSRAWWRYGDPEQGSISIWAVITAFAMIMLLGLAADLGGRTFAEQAARATAAQAARAGAQQVNLDTASRGDTVATDPHAAAAAAQTYLTNAGLTGTATVTAPDTITVTVTGTYETTFLTIIGISSLPIHGTSTATLVRSYQGTPR